MKKKLWLPLAITLLLAQCFFLYGNTARDDAFFTYWSAHSLAEYGKILNYSGDHVEQSSTLLHTLLLAASRKALPFIAIPTASWILSMLAGVITLLIFARILKDRAINTSATLILAASTSVVFWSSSGMEMLNGTALFTAVLWLCLKPQLSNRQRWLLIGSSAMAVLNRPEAFAVLLCFIVSAWPLQYLLRWSFKNVAHSSWAILLFTVAITAALVSDWRHFYFHDWFPQPVTAKQGSNWIINLFNGANYLIKSGDSITTQVIMLAGIGSALLSLLAWKHRYRTQSITCFLLALMQIFFILATGGDWMDAGRFLLPVLPAMLLSSVFFLAPWPRLLMLASIALAGFSLHESWQYARTQSTGFAITERATAVQKYVPNATEIRDQYSMAEWQSKDALRDIPQLESLKQLIQKLAAYPTPIRIASIQMGFIPYHLAIDFPQRLHFLDLRALSSRELTDCAPMKPFTKTSNGLIISYDQFFALLPVLQRQCSMQKPDILYDLGYDMRKQALQDNGYVTVYLETRHIQGTFSQRAIGSQLFVAIRKELAAQYGIPDIHGNIPVITPMPDKPHPNIVLVIADDVSYDKFGFMGNKAARTPTLDQLAQQGTVFTTAYVPTAFCRPSLATLLTGQWPHQTRLHANNGVPVMPKGTATLATRLQQNGYITFSGGKFWEDEPNLRGFDRYDDDRNNFARKNQDKLWKFLDDFSGKQPMFIWWAPMIPHRPHNAPAEFMNAIDENALNMQGIPAEKQQKFREAEKRLLAMNMWFDAEFKKLYQQLAARNQLENTAFIFLADNGFSNRGASKSAPYELGLRTPLIFYWPGHFLVQRIDAGVDTIDIFKTILDIANATTPSTPKFGRSLLPTIEKKISPAAEKLFGADYPAFTLKTDPLPRPERDIFALHVRDGDWKYIFFLRDVQEKHNLDFTIQKGVMPYPERKGGDEELFYLPQDPYERNNLSAQPENKTRVEEYRREVLHWWYSTGGKQLDVARDCQQTPNTAICKKLIGMPTL